MSWSPSSINARRARSTCALLAAGLPLALAGGCVDVNGGAVEVAWTIKDSTARVVDCESAGVTAMQLCGTPLAGGAPVCNQWACDEHYGATAFEIPEGTYAFLLTPICRLADSHVVGQVPPPLVRQIRSGDVASLDALLVVGTADGLVCAK
jgi:hypothetical protein